MAKTFEYNIKVNTNTDAVLSKFKEMKVEARKLADNEISIQFNYENNIAEINNIIKQIRENIPDLTIQFEYDVNKKMLASAEKELQKMNENSFSGLKENISSIYKEYVGAIEAANKNTDNSTYDKILDNFEQKLASLTLAYEKLTGDQSYEKLFKGKELESFFYDMEDIFDKIQDIQKVEIFTDEQINKQKSLVESLKSKVKELYATGQVSDHIGISVDKDAALRAAEEVKKAIDSIPNEKNIVINADISEFDNKIEEVINKLQGIKNFTSIDLNLNNNQVNFSDIKSLKYDFNEIVRAWREADLTRNETSERFVVANSKTGYFTNPFIEGNIFDVSSKIVNAAFNMAKDEVDTVIHTHPDDIAAFSETDIKSAFIDLQRGITQQIVIAGKEVMSLDMTKIEKSQQSNLLGEITKSQDFLSRNFKTVYLKYIEDFVNQTISIVENVFSHNIGITTDFKNVLLSKYQHGDFKNMFLAEYKKTAADILENIVQDKYEYESDLSEPYIQRFKTQLKTAADSLFQKSLQDNLIRVFNTPQFLKDGATSPLSIMSRDEFKFASNSDNASIGTLSSKVGVGVSPTISGEEFIQKVQDAINSNNGAVYIPVHPGIDPKSFMQEIYDALALYGEDLKISINPSVNQQNNIIGFSGKDAINKIQDEINNDTLGVSVPVYPKIEINSFINDAQAQIDESGQTVSIPLAIKENAQVTVGQVDAKNLIGNIDYTSVINQINNDLIPAIQEKIKAFNSEETHLSQSVDAEKMKLQELSSSLISIANTITNLPKLDIANKDNAKYINQIADSYKNLINVFTNNATGGQSIINGINELLSKKDELQNLAKILSSTAAQINAAKNVVGTNKITESQQLITLFADDFKKGITDFVSSKNEELVGFKLEAAEDGLVHITALAKDAGDQFKKYSITTANGVDLNVTKLEENYSALAKQINQYKKYQKFLQSITGEENAGKKNQVFTPDSDGWDKLIVKAASFGIQIDDIAKITRKVVDNLESFTLTDKFGNSTTIGMGSKDILMQSDKVVDVAALTKEYQSILSKLPALYAKQAKGSSTASDQLEVYKTRLDEIITSLKEYNKLIGGAGTTSSENAVISADIIKNLEHKRQTVEQDYVNGILNSLTNKFSGIVKNPKNGLESTGFNQEAIDKASFYLDVLNQIKERGVDINNKDAVSQFQQLQKEAEAVYAELIKLNSYKLGNISSLDKYSVKLSNFVKNNESVLSAEQIAKAKELQDQMAALAKSGDISAGSIKKLKDQVDAFIADASQLGNVVTPMQAFGIGIENTLNTIARRYLSLYRIVGVLRQGLQAIIQIDTALTELRKVSNASTERLNKSLKTSIATAKELGSTVNDIINVTSDYARMGYSVGQAEELARVTTLFKNVGDNMSAENASSYMISTMKGFNIAAEESMRIADVYNEVA